MSDSTNISWTDSTFNPWIGCTKVSPGCAKCYAEADFDHRRKVVKWGRGNPRKRTSKANWQNPIRWNRNQIAALAAAEQTGGGEVPPHRVFCASLADWLDDEVPIEWLADLLKLIYETPHLTWQLLTKRPQNFRARLIAVMKWVSDTRQPASNWWAAMKQIAGWLNGHPPAHVWIGTSVEDQRRADERIPLLLDIPARVRFLSCEPLLGPVDLMRVKTPDGDGPSSGLLWIGSGAGIDWVIIGGESGPGARPCNVEWVRSLKEQCQSERVACWVKQLGSSCITDGETPSQWPDGTHVYGLMGSTASNVRLLDPKGGDMSEWPPDLRLREFPQ